MSLQVHTISSNTSCYHLEKLPQKENRQSVFGGFQQWKDWFSIIWIIAIDIHIVKKAKTNEKCDGNDSVIIRMFVQLYFTILSLLNSCHQFLYLFILLGLVVVSWKPALKPKWVKKNLSSKKHVLLAPSGALIAIPTYYWPSSTPLFQITPVLNTGLSLSEPLQLYKGYNAI